MRAVVVLLSLLSGCTHVQLNSNTAPSSGAANVQVEAGRGLTAAVVAGAIVGVALQDFAQPRSRAPELSPDRTVNEQDCTKPIQLSGNLKCR
jgi:hypothetical protein